MKILTVIGARPQIIKAAAISRAISNHFNKTVNEIILHTGQHYDENMSDVFFKEMGVPQPAYNLNIGSGMHGKQTAQMISGIEEIIVKEKPSCIVIYGDTNSTLAGALAGSKLHIPVVHIEAGMRSFNKQMPEEINRVLADHVSTLLFTSTKTGWQNLMKEGFKSDNTPPWSVSNPNVFLCGDIMFDNSLYFADLAVKKESFLKKNRLEPRKYILVTIHRDFNTDDPIRLNNLFSAFDEISSSENIVFAIPLHPRTKKLLPVNLMPGLFKKVSRCENIRFLPPASYLEMIALEKNSRMIMTDSGGVQKEAFFFKKPCITLRPETEWVELVENGNNIIADDDIEKIAGAFRYFSGGPVITYPPFYGNGKTAEFIIEEVIKNL
ncbi:MAG: UDP-N-acetylglucosamine 2-epimerase (non-hydrolyzing) [Bacteroidetes bacterium]|nr:UDP-N-acetylglucosamine 2-epimerase (non-hydrolyzing) [Bacteroidota bacterium]